MSLLRLLRILQATRAFAAEQCEARGRVVCLAQGGPLKRGGHPVDKAAASRRTAAVAAARTPPEPSAASQRARVGPTAAGPAAAAPTTTGGPEPWEASSDPALPSRGRDRGTAAAAARAQQQRRAVDRRRGEAAPAGRPHRRRVREQGKSRLPGAQGGRRWGSRRGRSGRGGDRHGPCGHPGKASRAQPE